MTTDFAGLPDGALEDLLADLIRHESPDPPGREIEIARFVHGELERYGIEAELDEFAPGRANVLGRVRGAGRKPALVFSAHMDTMPPGTGEWTHGPYSGAIADGRIYGRGACDMKSGLAAMISAAVAARAEAGRLAGDVILAFTGGESSNCLGAKVLVEKGQLRDAGAILVSEPSTLTPLVAEKGALWLRLTARGRAGHTSGGAVDGNAILRMLPTVAAIGHLPILQGAHPLLGGASVGIGRIEGGTAVNLTPDLCHADIDIRFLPGHDPDAIEAAVAAANDGIEVERLDLKPAVETPADHPFVAACMDACRAVLGDDAAETPGGVGYFSDSSVLVPALGIPRVIVGPGTLGMSGAHDEYCELASLHAAARIFHRVARDWLAA